MTIPDDLRTKQQAATPLPWNRTVTTVRNGLEIVAECNAEEGTRNSDGTISGWPKDEANAAYIVAACNAVPDLLDEIERLREALRQ